MGRVVGSVVLGYVVMFAIVFLLFTATWLMLGTNGAFQPGTFEPSLAWIGATVVVDLVAATAGGFTAAALAKGDRRALWGLVGVVVVFGILSAVPMLTRGDVPGAVRGDSVTMMEAMQNARTPAWLALLNVALGVAGTYVGFRMRKAPAPESVAAA